MFTEISAILGTARESLAVYREIKSAKDGGPREQALADQTLKQLELQIDQARQALEHDKFRLAQLLRYQTCQCTFPPQIVLKETKGDRYVCQRCEAIYPDPRGFTVDVLT